MRTEQRHERYDLEERLVEFAVKLVEMVEALPDSRVCNHLAGQLIRSGTSPALNYGEAQSAESRSDFIHKIKIVLKELRECLVSLKIIKRLSLIESSEKLDDLIQEADELVAIFVKSASTAQKNNGKV